MSRALLKSGFRSLGNAQQEQLRNLVEEEASILSLLDNLSDKKQRIPNHEYISNRNLLRQRLNSARMELKLFRNQHGLGDSDTTAQFQRSTNPNAFGAAQVSSSLQTVSDLVVAAEKFLTLVSSASDTFGTTAAFASDIPPTESPMIGDDRGDEDEPLAMKESLMTVNARAYLYSTTEQRENQRDEDVSTTHFFQRKEQKQLDTLAQGSGKTIHCTVQSDDNVTGTVKGSLDDIQDITLWENGTKLYWLVQGETFPSPELYATTMNSMNAATGLWNDVMPGGVSFMRVEEEKDASFFVSYSGDSGIRDVIGFLPSRYVRNYSRITIHAQAFANGNRGNMTNYLLHHLGHVLGFRHSFVLENERRKREGEAGSSNPASVMSLKRPPVMAFSDIVDTRTIYSKFSGDGIHELSDGRGHTIKFRAVRVKA